MNTFFGSKLNTVLLVVLIIILLFTLNFMKNNDIEKEEIVETPVDEILPAMEGNVEDLVSFSVPPNSTISGILNFSGSVKNAYFFEGNILINVLDVQGNALLKSNAMATTNWMTIEPVEFEGNLDFTSLPKGPAYIEILEDDPSDGEGGEPGRILIPIVIE